MMKILLLSPHIDSEHKIAKRLKATGAALLFPANHEEAWQMLKLHRGSLDLAVVHREGSGGRGDDGGITFISKVKGDPAFLDLPIILSTQEWGDAQCSVHQSGPQGVNAYLL